MNMSPLHRKWFVSDIPRLILPPLSFGQYVTHRVDTKLVGFGSWAFMNESGLDNFLGAKKKMEMGDFISGHIPVVIDIIAPLGHGRHITSKMRRVLRDEGLSGKKIWYVRYYGDQRVAKVSVL